LVYFLMGSDTGRAVMSKLLDQMAANRCRHPDLCALLDQEYPGGIVGLEKAWSGWLLEGEPLPQLF
jgi:hypothetical protein